jgi:hypothetical protein
MRGRQIVALLGLLSCVAAPAPNQNGPNRAGPIHAVVEPAGDPPRTRPATGSVPTAHGGAVLVPK